MSIKVAQRINRKLFTSRMKVIRTSDSEALEAEKFIELEIELKTVRVFASSN